jgi:hypothetical protein
VDQWRPYWVWDALGLAHTGLLLVGENGHQDAAMRAFHQARDAIRAPRVIRRTRVFFEGLTEGLLPEHVAQLRSAALRTEPDDSR